MKTCTRCGVEKPRSEFPRNRTGKDGLYSSCRPCKAEIARESRRRTKEADPQGQLERWREYRRKYLYGIDNSAFDEMLASQGGGCAICGKTPDEDYGNKRLNIDHCHSTGTVRELLCGACNRGLGCFNDNPELLDAARQYLLKHRKEVAA